MPTLITTRGGEKLKPSELLERMVVTAAKNVPHGSAFVRLDQPPYLELFGDVTDTELLDRMLADEDMAPSLAGLRARVLVTGPRKSIQAIAPRIVAAANPSIAALVADEDKAPHRIDFTSAAAFGAWLKDEGLTDYMRVLVCGSRRFAARDAVALTLAQLAEQTVVIEGEARGADLLGRNVAMERGLPVAGFPARWAVTSYTPQHRIRVGSKGPYDVAAGNIRNQVMARCRPGLCIAFTDDLTVQSGTRNMVRLMLAYGVTVWHVNSAGERRVIAELPDELPPELAADLAVEALTEPVVDPAIEDEAVAGQPDVPVLPASMESIDVGVAFDLTE